MDSLDVAVEHLINLVDDGSAPLASVSLATVATSSSILDTDPTNGLQMTVTSCSVVPVAPSSSVTVSVTV